MSNISLFFLFEWMSSPITVILFHWRILNIIKRKHTHTHSKYNYITNEHSSASVRSGKFIWIELNSTNRFEWSWSRHRIFFPFSFFFSFIHSFLENSSNLRSYWLFCPFFHIFFFFFLSFLLWQWIHCTLTLQSDNDKSYSSHFSLPLQLLYIHLYTFSSIRSINCQNYIHTNGSTIHSNIDEFIFWINDREQVDRKWFSKNFYWIYAIVSSQLDQSW